MSIIGFLFKSKNNMAKKNTKDVRVGKYTLTKHAQHRIVDPEKDFSLRTIVKMQDKINDYERKFEKEQDVQNQNQDEITY